MPRRHSSRALPLARALDIHRSELAACRRCQLPHFARPVVSEARAPRVMLVGQAPGRVEVDTRRPFSGRAGKVLFRWFERAGVSEESFRANVYIAAVTRCFPGPHPSGRGDRVPTPAERGTCGTWLDAELRLIRPPVLLLVGRLAIDRFLGPGPLDALVGRAHEVAHVGGRSIAIPLPHPSGASSWLNAPAHKALLDDALRLVHGELATLGLVEGVERVA